MAKNYELRKIWGFGPFKRRKMLASFESRYMAEYVMGIKLLTAKRKGKKLVLEVIDMDTQKVLSRKSSR